jgi:hypothetical protein
LSFHRASNSCIIGCIKFTHDTQATRTPTSGNRQRSKKNVAPDRSDTRMAIKARRYPAVGTESVSDTLLPGLKSHQATA